MRTIGRVILSAIFVVLTGLMAAAAKYLPDMFFSFYSKFSQGILSKIGAITGVFPFAVWEVLALVLILWAIYTFVRCFRRLGVLRWLSGLLLGFSIGLFLFVGLWGLNHFGPTIDARLGLELRQYTAQELEQATSYYAAKASELAELVERDGSGVVAFSDFGALANQAATGYDRLSGQYEGFTSRLSKPKKLFSWYLFSHFGTTGIFIPFTAESCVNPDTFEASIPYTMCHELAHRQAVARENEANFCAFLACAENPSIEFQYSGYYSAFIYCYNALHKSNPEAADQIWQGLAQNLKTDCLAADEHYRQYEGKVQQAAQMVNDTYLKAFSEESGIQSYGEVADLLISWYLQKVV